MKKKVVLVFGAMLLSAGGSFVEANPNVTPAAAVQPETLKGSVVTVPAGQTFRVFTTMPLSTETLTKGQQITTALTSDFYYGANLIAPKGSTILGTVIDVAKSKHGNVSGKLLVRFNMIIAPYGVQVPIAAVIKTSDNTGTLVGGTKMGVASELSQDVIVGAGVGALAGVVISPLAGGSIGKGTALATAVGAGGGLAKGLWDKGEDVLIPVNSSIELILTQPVTVNPAQYNHNE